MNSQILIRHIKHFIEDMKENPDRFNKDYKERLLMVDYYQSFTREKIIAMTEQDIYEYISQLWAMLIWGNKHYVVDKIIEENGLENLKNNLASIPHINSYWVNFIPLWD